MRLTLRTLLAYLDDILEPQDSEDLARKIEESEFATVLVHRTRDCMRRLRLGVPPVTGKGLASDPNTVAEYLDNTLPGERVAEFEKICLESDIHLAEVAACHQILTLVLGEPAEIDPRSRARMYRVASEADAPPIQADAVPVANAHDGAAVAQRASAAPPMPPRRHKPEVPEYLRETRSRWWPVAAAAAVGALVTAAALFLLIPGTWRDRLLGRAPVEEAASVEPATTQAAAALTAPATTPANAAATATGETPVANAAQPAPADGAPSATNAAAPATAAAAAPATGLERPRAATEPDPNAPPAPLPGEGQPAAAPPGADPAAMPAQPGPAQPGAEAPPTGEQPPADPAAAAARTAPAAEGTPAPGPSADEPLPIDLAPAGEAPVAGATADAASAPAEAGAARGEAAEAAFGRYTSKRGEVLLRFDRQSGDWKRLPPMAPLAKGDRLLSLPLYRPSISLSTSISMQPDGAAEMEFVGWTPEGAPIVNLAYGRLLMMTVGKAGNAIQLKLGDETVDVTFVDAESTVALEARRLPPRGKDPTAEPAPQAVDLYATSGLVRVRVGGSAPVDIQAPQRRALVGDGITQGDAVPAWVTSEALSDSDRRAMATVEVMLPPDQLVGLILKELTGDRRREVRSLAIRSAACLDNFEPCIDALNEKDEKNFWTTYIEELRAGMARNPETAKRIQNTFNKQRGAEGEPLFRMLWSYSAEDLRNGADQKLVEGLDSDSLDHRVLAFWNLRDITGLPNYGYYPEHLTKQRTQSVNTWKERLRQGKIVPRATTAAAPKPRAATKAATAP
ncbi:MAG: hypothetical protein AB7O59_24875 [Pirellulales bacterium]